MQQGSLFPTAPNAYGDGIPAPLAPRAANDDPVSSSDAIDRHEQSGRAGRHRDIVLALLEANPNSTGHELWSAASDADQAELGSFPEVYRRLNDLRHVCLAVQGEMRRCRIRGTKMVTWSPTSQAN
jgi:hypothetical protein